MAQNNTYTTGGAVNWTCPTGVVQVTVECWAGGGGAGSNNSTSATGGGGGAGGGAYASSVVTVVPGTTYNCNVGNRGNYGASNNSNGANGNNTDFNNSEVRAANGRGGNRNGYNGAGGLASASVGSTKYNGGYGGNGASGNGGGGGAGAARNAAGANGSGRTGGTGSNGGGSGGTGGQYTNNNGTAGATYGGGGGGSSNGNNSSKRGGNGANGALIITWTGYTCTCSSGSFTWDDPAMPTLEVSMPAGTNSFAWTGTAATLTKGKTLFTEPGEFTHTGTAVTLKIAAAVATVAFALSGTAATLTKGYRIAPDPGSFTMQEAGAGALSRTSRFSASSGSQSGSWITSSFTVTPNSLLVVTGSCIINNDAGGDPSGQMAVSGGGLSWSKRVNIGNTNNYPMGTCIWTATNDGSSSIQLTFSCASRPVYTWLVAVCDYLGFDPTTPTGGKGSLDHGPTDGAAQFNLDATPASNSQIIAQFFGDYYSADSFSCLEGSGWSELYDFKDGTGCETIETQALSGPTSASVDWQDVKVGSGNMYCSQFAALEIRAGAGAGTNLKVAFQPDTGSFAETGTDLDLHVAMVPDSGAYVWTGTEATLTKSAEKKQIVCDPGEFLWTGTDATPKVAMVPDTAAFALVGTDATPRVAMVPGGGSFGWTGTEATLKASHTPIVPGSGEFTETGTAITPRVSMPVDTTAYAWTGTAATLRKGFTIACDVGQFNLTGTAATPKIAVVPDSGTFAWTGTECSLKYSGSAPILDAGSGQFDLTGTPVTLRVAVVPDTAAFSMAGSEATLRVGMPPESGAFALAGTDLDLHVAMPTDPGEFELAGTDATLKASHTDLVVEPGEFEWVGTDVDLYTGVGAHTIECEPGVFTWTGTEANLVYVHLIPPPTLVDAYEVPPEDRSYVVPAEDRSYEVPYEDRGLPLGEVRSFHTHDPLEADAGEFTWEGQPATLKKAAVPPITSGLLAWWPMDEGSGDILYDASPSGWHLTQPGGNGGVWTQYGMKWDRWDKAGPQRWTVDVPSGDMMFVIVCKGAAGDPPSNVFDLQYTPVGGPWFYVPSRGTALGMHLGSYDLVGGSIQEWGCHTFIWHSNQVDVYLNGDLLRANQSFFWNWGTSGVGAQIGGWHSNVGSLSEVAYVMVYSGSFDGSDVALLYDFVAAQMLARGLSLP